MNLLINEVFYSIQGEGYSAGFPTVFVRLQGCNLACSWCDTKYAQSEKDNKKYMQIDVDTLFSTICSYINHSHICITGGEPLLQNDALILLLDKIERCKEVQDVVIQTNGSLDIRPFLLPKVIIAMDYKLESSGFMDKMLHENLIALREKDEIKFVVADRNDFELSLDLQNKYSMHSKIVYSPVFPLMQYDDLANMILKSNIHCKYSLQIFIANIHCNYINIFGRI